MPIGLHMGTNVVSAIVFSDGPWGAQWLVPSTTPSDPGMPAAVVVNLLWPLVGTGVVLWLIRWYGGDPAPVAGQTEAFEARECDGEHV